MKGVILAAGKGTRLYPVTKAIAKPLLPLANRMTIEYAFDQLKECGVTDVCLVVGENESEMRQALGDGSAFGVNLAYAKQTDPLGLAHAVGFAKDFIGGDEFILYLGDAIYSDSLRPFVDQYRAAGAANLNLVKWVDDPRRFGVATLDGDRITKLVEKPANPDTNWAMAAMYIFGPQLWEVLPDLKPSARGEYEITDAIQMMVDRGHLVIAGKYEGSWFDTGTLDSFLATSRYLAGTQGSIDASAKVTGDVGPDVVIGKGAVVECAAIRDSVVLPGAQIKVDGEIRGCVLGGDVTSSGDLADAIRFGDLD